MKLSNILVLVLIFLIVVRLNKSILRSRNKAKQIVETIGSIITAREDNKYFIDKHCKLDKITLEEIIFESYSEINKNLHLLRDKQKTRAERKDINTILDCQAGSTFMLTKCGIASDSTILYYTTTKQDFVKFTNQITKNKSKSITTYKSIKGNDFIIIGLNKSNHINHLESSSSDIDERVKNKVCCNKDNIEKTLKSVVVTNEASRREALELSVTELNTLNNNTKKQRIGILNREIDIFNSDYYCFLIATGKAPIKQVNYY